MNQPRGLLPIVLSEWNKEFQGTQQFILCSKLKSLKGPLKQLNNLHLSHICSRVKAAADGLKDAIAQLHVDP